MKRIDTSTAQADKHGTGKAGFSNSTPTMLDASWCDAVQEELAGAIEGLGELEPSNDAQLDDALTIARLGPADRLLRNLEAEDSGDAVAWSAAGCDRVVVIAGGEIVRYAANPGEWLSPLAPLGTTWRSLCAAEDLGIVVGVGTYTSGTPPRSFVLDVSDFSSSSSTSLSGAPYAWSTVAYSPALGIFCALSSGTTRGATSADGSTWSEYATAPEAHSLIWCDGLGLFFALGFSSAATSVDGITWTSVTLPAGTWRGCTYSPRYGLVIVGDSARVALSQDGASWETYDIAAAVLDLNVVDFCSISWAPALGAFVLASRAKVALWRPDERTPVVTVSPPDITDGGWAWAWAPRANVGLLAFTSTARGAHDDDLLWLY
jgi:hypothetical protein